MKTRLICWITIACITFITLKANEPKEIKNTTIQITCPKEQPSCVLRTKRDCKPLDHDLPLTNK